jgi:hypothetical protein
MGRTSLRLFSKYGVDQEVEPYHDALLIPFRVVRYLKLGG